MGDGWRRSTSQRNAHFNLGTMDWRFHTPLTGFSDSQILDVLAACSEVGKILERKGFKVIY